MPATLQPVDATMADYLRFHGPHSIFCCACSINTSNPAIVCSTSACRD